MPRIIETLVLLYQIVPRSNRLVRGAQRRVRRFEVIVVEDHSSAADLFGSAPFKHERIGGFMGRPHRVFAELEGRGLCNCFVPSAIVDEHHLFDRRFVVEVVVNALFLEQAVDEIEIAFAILDTIIARRIGLRKPELKISRKSVFAKHVLYDVDNRLFLKDTQIRAASQKPEPRPNLCKKHPAVTQRRQELRRYAGPSEPALFVSVVTGSDEVQGLPDHILQQQVSVFAIEVQPDRRNFAQTFGDARDHGQEFLGRDLALDAQRERLCVRDG